MNLVGAKPTAGTPSVLRRVRVRPAMAGDRGFAMSLVPRLVADSAAHWRIPRKTHAAYVAVIDGLLESAGSLSVLLIGEQEFAVPMGIALLSSARDGYTHRCRGHLVQIAVPERPDRSVEVRALLEATGTWARLRGLVLLTPAGFRSRHPAAALRFLTDTTESSRRQTPSTGGEE